jgi:hypothetical protein
MVFGVGGWELKDWVPDKDILGSPLRFEDLRIGGFLNWVPDKDIPESMLRSEDLRCASRIWGGDFFITAEDTREVSAGLVSRQEDGGQARLR